MKAFKYSVFAILVLIAACSSDKKADQAPEAAGKKKQEGKFLPYERFMYPSGELQMAGKLVKGKRNGAWTSWFKDGTQNSEATFVNDQMHGPYRVWYENGKLRMVGQYELDKQIGTWYFFLENGDTARVINYDSLKTPVK